MNKKIPLTKQIPAPIRNHLLKQQESSQTIKEYCRKNGIPVQTFYTWRKRFKKQNFATTKTEGSVPQVSFASLGTLNTQLQQGALFDIRFSSGTAISVYTGITAEELAPFLNIVSRSNVQC